MLLDKIVYLREFLTEFTTTGSILPSSPWAARALSSPLRGTTEPQRILEVGPGTGAVTAQILRDMHEGDSLTICEINSRFMAALKKKLAKNEDFQRHKDRITFFEGPVQDMPDSGRFDLIICAIPFLNLPLTIVKEIFIKLEQLSFEHTSLTFFEYLGIREINLAVAMNERRERMKEIDQFFDKLHRDHESHRKIVWLNVTPINIYTMRLKRAA